MSKKLAKPITITITLTCGHSGTWHKDAVNRRWLMCPICHDLKGLVK